MLFDPLATQVIDYGIWQEMLNKYLVLENGQSYFQYQQVSAADKALLAKTIKHLSQIKISRYNRDEQLAYWINLYNILTVDVILKNPKVTSITQIEQNWLGQTQVWDTPVITVEAIKLTLNDIEHRILRPIWNDPRIHAAVNCASLGCPDLSAKAYTGKEINAQLNATFFAFINSSKGLLLQDNKLLLSKIFQWYGSDFGDQSQMFAFIGYFVRDQKLQNLLKQPTINIGYQDYDWNLNTKG